MASVRSKVGIIEMVIVIALIALVLSFVFSRTNSMTVVKSSVDWRRYVVRNTSDKQRAADTLALVTKDMITLVQHMRRKYPKDEDVKRMVNNFNPDNIMEASDHEDADVTSYSLNKGQQIVMCIRSKEDEKLEDRNIVTYVAIHELAHLMTESVGHKADFWKNNKRLLAEAVSLGIYQNIDFVRNPKQYCGMKVSTNVL